MSIRDLQSFLESTDVAGGTVPVDLLRIARDMAMGPGHKGRNNGVPIPQLNGVLDMCNRSSPKLRLVLDAEHCLDRLYGGYFSDWACGGQWNRMFNFLSLLTETVERGNIDLTVFFNGTMDASRQSEWIKKQAYVRMNVGLVLKHINTKATPPPKVWWTAPTCLRTALRMALRRLGITVICSEYDHQMEVVEYCRLAGVHGLIADDAEYLLFGLPRYFSSIHMKLTYKGSLETKEYAISEMLKTLGITADKLCVMAALFTNFMPREKGGDVYKKIQSLSEFKDKLSGATAVRAVAKYVQTLPSPSQIDDLVTAVLGSLKDPRADAFKELVLYYMHGRPESNHTVKQRRRKSKGKVVNNNNNNSEAELPKVFEEADVSDNNTTEFASETTEQEQEALRNYNLATAFAHVKENNSYLNLITNKMCSLTFEDADPIALHLNGNSSDPALPVDVDIAAIKEDCPKVNLLARPSSAPNDESGGAIAKENNRIKETAKRNSDLNIVQPSVTYEVKEACRLRHRKGLMCPMMLHLLESQEIRLPCVMEYDSNRELPPIHEVFLPLRKKIYAVLFNLHHVRFVHVKNKATEPASTKKSEAPSTAADVNVLEPTTTVPETNGGSETSMSPSKTSASTTATTSVTVITNSTTDRPPEIIVKEYVYSRSNPYQTAEEVRAEALPWAVPTLSRLWFGPTFDDQRRRMRALLSCLNCDTPLILNKAYVPQHMLIMACVLRYIMTLDRPIFRRPELDVFLCQAFDPHLMNIQYLQDLTLNVVTSRGVQLAALFMQGVEMALLANDACGAPWNWLLCVPWLFFDGKLFHHTLNRSTHAKNLLELCESQIDRIVKVERMRKAILEGLEPKFLQYGHASPYAGLMRQPIMPSTLPQMMMPLHPAMPGANASCRQPGPSNASLRRPMSGRGGQLHVAGMVVGSWGPNYRFQQNNSAVSGSNTARTAGTLAGSSAGNSRFGPGPAGGSVGYYAHQGRGGGVFGGLKAQPMWYHQQQQAFGGPGAGPGRQHAMMRGGRGGGSVGGRGGSRKVHDAIKKPRADKKKKTKKQEVRKANASKGEEMSVGTPQAPNKAAECGQGDGPSVERKRN